MLNHLLTENGLDPGVDVTVEYKSEATEVAALLATEPGAVGVLPQPYVTVVKAQNPGVRTALDLTDEWAEVNPDSELVTGVVVIRTAFATSTPTPSRSSSPTTWCRRSSRTTIRRRPRR